MGYTPQLVAGVWMGNDDSSPTSGASRTAALAWYEFVSQFIDDLPVEEFPELPKLGGREGTIKAKPISPRRTIVDKPDRPEPVEQPEEDRRPAAYREEDPDEYLTARPPSLNLKIL